MNTTSLKFLFEVAPPWIYVGQGEDERRPWIPSAFYARPGVNVCVRQLRATKMRTGQRLMDEFAAALQFFEGFGENWHALEECLEYMDEWLPADAYVLVIENAEVVLADEELGELEQFLKVLNTVGEWWSQPIEDNDRFNRRPIPFHCLCHVSGDQEVGRSRLVLAAQRANIALRTDH